MPVGLSTNFGLNITLSSSAQTDIASILGWKFFYYFPTLAITHHRYVIYHRHELRQRIRWTPGLWVTLSINCLSLKWQRHTFGEQWKGDGKRCDSNRGEKHLSPVPMRRCTSADTSGCCRTGGWGVSEKWPGSGKASMASDPACYNTGSLAPSGLLHSSSNTVNIGQHILYSIKSVAYSQLGL